jgi:hypothetical protein
MPIGRNDDVLPVTCFIVAGPGEAHRGWNIARSSRIQRPAQALVQRAHSTQMCRPAARVSDRARFFLSSPRMSDGALPSVGAEIDVTTFALATTTPIAALFDAITDDQIQQLRRASASELAAARANPGEIGTVAAVIDLELHRDRDPIEILIVGVPDIFDLLDEDAIRQTVSTRFRGGGGAVPPAMRLQGRRSRAPATATQRPTRASSERGTESARPNARCARPHAPCWPVERRSRNGSRICCAESTRWRSHRRPSRSPAPIAWRPRHSNPQRAFQERWQEGR